MKTRRIEVIKPIIAEKTTNHNNFGCSRKVEGPVITKTDLRVRKNNLGLDNVHKKIFRKIIFIKLLTAISCPLKALDRFT